MPELHEAGLAAESEHLQEEAGKGSEVAAAKGGDAGVVGVLIGCQHAEGQLFPGGLLDLA